MYTICLFWCYHANAIMPFMLPYTMLPPLILYLNPLKSSFLQLLHFITTIPILRNEGYLIKYDENDRAIGIILTKVAMVDVLD